MLRIQVDRDTLARLEDNCIQGKCEECLLYGVCDPEHGVDLNTFIEVKED